MIDDIRSYGSILPISLTYFGPEAANLGDQSEVADLFCRLPLPTLFYQPEAVNLGDLMRLWVRTGVQIIMLTWLFKDS